MKISLPNLEKLKNKEGETSVDDAYARVSQLSTITVISAFVAAGSLVFAIATQSSTASELARGEDDLSTVVVAAKSIPAGSRITADMLQTAQVPSAYVGDSCFTSIGKAVGRQTVVRIDKNSQLRTSEVTGHDLSSSLASRIAKGQKAVSIDVSTEEDFAGALLHQGDKVTLYHFVGSNQEQKILVKDATVLALDGFTSYSDLSSDGITASYSHVTIEVSKKKAVEIRKVQNSAESIWFVLSATADGNR